MDKTYYIIFDKRIKTFYGADSNKCFSLYEKRHQAEREINLYEPDYRKHFEIREYKLIQVK